MPNRLQLAIGDQEWTTEIAGAEVSVDGQKVSVEQHGQRLHAAVGDRVLTGRAVVDGDTVWVAIGGEVFAVRVRHGARHASKSTSDRDAFVSPMSATVVRIAVAPGDRVSDGDVLIALEAMKMELPIRAPRDGVVRAIHCQEGDLVQPDQVLLEFE